LLPICRAGRAIRRSSIISWRKGQGT